MTPRERAQAIASAWIGMADKRRHVAEEIERAILEHAEEAKSERDQWEHQYDGQVARADAAVAELDAWKHGQQGKPACFNCGAPCEHAARIADLEAALLVCETSCTAMKDAWNGSLDQLRDKWKQAEKRSVELEAALKLNAETVHYAQSLSAGVATDLGLGWPTWRKQAELANAAYNATRVIENGRTSACPDIHTLHCEKHPEPYTCCGVAQSYGLQLDAERQRADAAERELEAARDEARRNWHSYGLEQAANEVERRRADAAERAVEKYKTELATAWRELEAAKGEEVVRLGRRVAELEQACTTKQECIDSFKDERDHARELARRNAELEEALRETLVPLKALQLADGQNWSPAVREQFSKAEPMALAALAAPASPAKDNPKAVLNATQDNPKVDAERDRRIAELDRELEYAHIHGRNVEIERDEARRRVKELEAASASPATTNVADPSSKLVAASPATATWDDSDSDENYAAEARLRAPYRSDKRTPVKRKSDSLDTHSKEQK